MTERRPVEMVRLEKQEQVYDVAELGLGRSAADVFPSRKADEVDPIEQLKSAIGAKRFVTESELEQIKAARGLNVEDGTMAADKPLAEVLAEAKRAKQEAFDDKWRQMKTGKNRPLDPEELEFYESLARQEAEAAARLSREEAEQLEAYRLAVAAAAEAKAAAAAAPGEAEADASLLLGEGDGVADAGPGPGSSLLARSASGGAAKAKPDSAGGIGRAGSKPSLPALKPVLKVRPKGAAPSAPDSKRPRLQDGAQQQLQQQQQQAGLAGLLGGYGSGSEEGE